MKKSKVKESVVEKFVAVEKSHEELLLMCINNELEKRKNKCKAYQEKFEEDYLHAFRWHGEEMCIEKIWVNQISWILKKIEVDGDTISDVFAMYLNMYEGHLKSPHNVRINSTSALARELSIYEYQTYIDLRSYLLNLKKGYPKAF